MQATFESILPIFLLILAGNALKRLKVADDAAWSGMDQLGYWFFYPILIFVTIINADFGELQLDSMMLALAITLPLMFALTLGLWLPLRNAGLVDVGEYSSIFQTAVRWNGFMALAIAQKLFGPTGMAVVALVMAVIILPINLVTVLVITKFADKHADWPTLLKRMISNPMIIAASGGILMRTLPFDLYAPLNQTLELIGRTAIGMGLVAIGAGLRIGSLWQPRIACLVPIVIKLVIFPAVLMTVSLTLGIHGQQLLYLVLCGAVPTAMNGYVLARQMGGDAELYATVTTQQTLLSFLTIPAVLAIAAQLSAG